ncbi:MAG: tetratricopeptide repeat protein [Deltaproteobacteria bacterium]|jgi:tetratricopeptide (TPR) repeat protein|nr:tetratricopeptide repeat protein [Deltaproteobacteria bacterium]
MDARLPFYHSSPKGRGKSPAAWGKSILAVAALLGLILAFWYAFFPDSLARAWGWARPVPLEVKSLELMVDRAPRTLAPSETLELNPAQNLFISALSTNHWRNYGLSLSSPDFDLTRFYGAPTSLLRVLGEDAWGEPRTLAIEVWEDERRKAIFFLKVAYAAEDWVARGDATADGAEKVSFYRKALALDPDAPGLKDKFLESLAHADGFEEELAALLEEEWRASGDDPQSYNILSRLLALYRELGDGAQEIVTLERMLPLADPQGDARKALRTSLANLYRETQPAKAAVLYEELLSESQDEGETLSLLALLLELYRQSADQGREARVLERLLPLATPERAPGIWSELIRLREDLGDKEGALAAWAGLAKSLPDGPLKADAYKRLGSLYAGEGAWALAEVAFLEAARLAPGDFAVFQNLSAIALERGNREAYLVYLQRTLALNDNPALARELALALEEAGRGDEAAAIWLKLAELALSGPEAEATRAEARLKVLELSRPAPGEVAEEFTQKLYRYSQNGVEFYNLGVAYFKKKNWDAAEKAFLQAIDYSTKDQAAREDSGAYLVALYREKGDKEAMLKEAARLYEEFPARKEFRDLVVGELEIAKNWTRLSQTASNWVKIYPQDADNWRYLALAQKNLGQAPALIVSLLKIAELDPTAATWLAAAEALENSGDLAQAKAAYEKVLALDEANDRAGQAILRMTLSDLATQRGGREAN